MRSAKDLARELYYWIHIGTAEDIVNCPNQRKEYQHLVLIYKDTISATDIPNAVLNVLLYEMTKPKWRQLIFWRLFWFDLKN